MKILFITHYDNLYGANKAMYKLISKLVDQKDYTPIVVIPAEGQFSSALEKMGVKVIINNVTQWQAMYAGFARFMVKKHIRKKSFLAEVNEIYKKLQETGDLDIDLIHSNSSVVGTGAFLARRIGCKHVWHIREFSKEHFSMKYFFGKGQVAQLYSEADCLIAISDALAENYRNRYPKAHVVRVYDGVDAKEEGLNQLETEKEQISDSKLADEAANDYVFAYVGYLFEKKNQHQIIEACKILKDQGIENYKVYIIGDGKDDYKNKLINLIESYKLKDNVILTGYVSDVDKFLSKANCGIIGSDYEGFGLVTVEYMLKGLPVLGKRSGATPEIVLDRETGLLYDNTVELADNMKTLMNDKKLGLHMGKKGLERAKNCFSEESNAEQIINIYRELSR